MTAATRREVLAKAVAAWINQPWTDEHDLPLETALIETHVIEAGTEIFEFDTTEDFGLRVITEDGIIEIDKDGNVMKGAT